MNCLIDKLHHFYRLTRKTFDTSDTKNEFGPIRIEFGKVQSKVSLKYDSWHKDVLSKFGNLLGNKMTDFHTSVSKVSRRLIVLMFEVVYGDLITGRLCNFTEFNIHLALQLTEHI